MEVRNTLQRWGAVSQLFHWVIVFLIIAQYTLAEVAEDLPLGMQKFETYALHKSIGISILGLAVLRLLWRWVNPTPELPNTLKPYERFLARAVHFGLYAFLFLQPITGWIMSNAENFPVSYFGWFTLPDLVAPDEDFGELLEEVHKALFKGMLVLAALHVAAALKHHFWLKDDVLSRMLPFGSAGRGSP